MSKVLPPLVQQELASALRLMEEALEVLDRHDATLHVSAHIDLAISRLRELIGQGSETGEVPPES